MLNVNFSICLRSPSPSLGILRLSGLLELSHLEKLVRLALLVRAVGLTELRNVHHSDEQNKFRLKTKFIHADESTGYDTLDQ